MQKVKRFINLVNRKKSTIVKTISCILFITLLLTLFTSCSYITFEGLDQMFNKREITAFSFNKDNNPGLSSNFSGVIRGNTIYINVPYGTELSSLVPSISIEGSGIEPANGKAQSFQSKKVYTVIADDGSTTTYIIEVIPARGDLKEITSFSFLKDPVNPDLSSSITGTIEDTQIYLVLPYNKTRGTFIPDITINGASLSPASGTGVDFSSGSYEYTVTALDGSQSVYTVNVTIAPSPEKAITSFSFPAAPVNFDLAAEINGTFEGTNISLEVPNGISREFLKPEILISDDATVSPASLEGVDFSTGPVVYTVTAANGDQEFYNVKVTEAPSDKNEIISFAFNESNNNPPLSEDVTGDIDGTNITVVLPLSPGTAPGILYPAIELPEGAAVEPASLSPVFFDSDPVTFKVTAENGDIRNYLVTVICDDQGPSVPDKTLTAEAIGETSVTISWKKAEDFATPGAELEYKLVYSKTELDTLEKAEDALTGIGLNWTADTLQKELTGLERDTKYYFNVLVRDGDDKKVLYHQLQVKTFINFTEQLTAFYKFSGDYDDTTANNIDLDAIGGVSRTENRSGAGNSACLFGPGKDFLTTDAHDEQLNFTGEFTISFWVNLSNVSKDQKILGKAFAIGDDVKSGYAVGVKSGGILFEVWDTDGEDRSIFSSAPGTDVFIAADTWTHITIVWETGGTMTLYKDGLFVAEKEATDKNVGSTSNNFILGTCPWNTTANMNIENGKIDDIRIYNAAVTQPEVTFLAAIGPD